MNEFILIDAMSIVFRAYHALFNANLKSPSGEPTSAVFSFTNQLFALLEKKKPQKIIFCFDTQAPTFRHKQFPQYKANREVFPEELVPQLERIKQIIHLLGIPLLEVPGFEADDLIGTLAKDAEQKGVFSACITNDKDFYQLVSEKIVLYKPKIKGSDDFTIVDVNEVKKKYGVAPEQVVDVLALIGDASDNIPGVRGIGEKTAIQLIQKFGSIESLYENIEQVSPVSIRQKLIEDKENALTAKGLIKIKTDVPVPIKIDDIYLREPKIKELDALFAELGFTQVRMKLRKLFADSFAQEVEHLDKDEKTFGKDGSETIGSQKRDYVLVDSVSQLEELILELKGQTILAVDIETSSLDKNFAEIVGISLSFKENSAYYIPVLDKNDDHFEAFSSSDNSLFSATSAEKKNEKDGFERQFLPMAVVIEKLKPILEDEGIGKCGQNIKFDAYILKRYGVNVAPIVFDTMVASHLLEPDGKHNLEAISQKWLNYSPISISTLIGEKKSTQKSMKELEPAEIKDYACEDADLALRLTKILREKLIEEGLFRTANEIEFPLIEVLVQLEFNGVCVDTDILNDLNKKIQKTLGELKNEIYKEAGMEFNIDSPKQLAYVLFEKLKIPAQKTNKTGFSTDVQVLEELSRSYPIAGKVLDYRQLSKLKSTYVEALPKLINPKTGRIHTTFNQTVVSTGRLSSTEPNLQNIPIRSDLGKEIRKAFVPQFDDYVILSADYSQIELRIMAYYSQDENLIKAFAEGKDIHSSTASLLFDIPIDRVTPDMRRAAKAVNFGIMYGLGSFGLAQRLGISKTEAGEIIRNYLNKYSGIKKYIDEIIKATEKKGYAETLFGRRRYFKNINSKNKTLKSADERAAINMPIQGTASDLMKIAMIKIHRQIKEENLLSKMILQVHDELVFEVPEKELERMKEIVKINMEGAVELKNVPLVVDLGVGANWFSAH